LAGRAFAVPNALHPDWVELDQLGQRWFGFLTDQMIRRGVHKSLVALEKDIHEWVKN
jgi:hypothetical protein